MEEAFFVGYHAASEFGAELLASYTVSGSSITQNYVVSRTGSSIVPCSTLYGLRTITLPVDIYGDTPEDAAAKRSALTAVLLDGPVELYLPDGGIYTALLEDSGRATVWDDAGCLLNCTYTLVGYRHGPLETVLLPHWYLVKGDYQTFFADGNAAQMECRITATIDVADTPDTPYSLTVQAAETTTATVHYPDGGACTVSGVKLGDTIIVDGIEKQVLINGANAFQNVTTISGWPTVHPGENALLDWMNKDAYFYADPCAIEYYPIFV